MKAGWQTKTLGDVCTVVNGGTPKTGVTDYWDGSHLWITPAEMGKRLSPYVDETERRITDLGLRDSSARMLPENSVILSSRAPIGYLVINTKRMATNQGCKGLVPARELDHKFLYYYLSSIVDLLNELGTGATFKELSGGKLKEVAIPFPYLSEQQRIVTLLDEAFDGIATAKANAEKNRLTVRSVFESHLQSVFTEQGAGWKCLAFEDTVDSACTLSYGIVQPGEEYAGGLPIVRPTDLGTKIIAIEGLKRIDPALANSYRRTTLRGGDLLLCVRGTTGQLSIASSGLTGANVTRGIVPIFFERTVLSQDLGYYLMRSDFVQSQIREKTYGTALQQINIGDLRNLKLPIPPKADQEVLTTKFNELGEQTQRLESIYQQKLVALDELKKSLLHQAFSGAL
jgi:type I restriction enzyme, S subunit